MDLTIEQAQGRDSLMSAEGANVGQAKPDETLRQKDPAPEKLWKTLLQNAKDTDGVNLVR